MGVELVIYVTFGLCVFALLNPLIAFNRRTSTYFLVVFSSIVQLMLYHQLFRWDIVGVAWRSGLFVILLVVVIVGIRSRAADRSVMEIVWLWRT